MLAVILFVVVFALVSIARRKNIPVNSGKFEVFSFSGSQLTVLAGIPVTYDVSAIENVVFTKQRSRAGGSYTGILRIVKTDGKKSRPFIFDGSVVAKKLMLVSTEQDINNAITCLKDELRAHNIRSSW